MNNSILTGKNVSPLKQNMENGQFSLMRKIWRNTRDTNTNEAGLTVNYTYQDSSSYMERKKAKAIGNKSYNSPLNKSESNYYFKKCLVRASRAALTELIPALYAMV